MDWKRNPFVYVGIGVVILLVILVVYFQLSSDSGMDVPDEEEVIEGCGDGTVIYQNDRLCWQKSSMSKLKNWQAANDYCENLILAERDDWRLPTTDELMQIVDTSYEPAINPRYFTGTEPSQYWTSSIYKDGMHWYIHFELGYQGFGQDFMENYNARCVRDSTLF